MKEGMVWISWSLWFPGFSTSPHFSLKTVQCRDAVNTVFSYTELVITTYVQKVPLT